MGIWWRRTTPLKFVPFATKGGAIRPPFSDIEIPQVDQKYARMPKATPRPGRGE